MRRTKQIGLAAIVALLLAFPLVVAQAQQQQRNRGDRQQRMQEMRQRMSEQMQKALGVDDATWKVLQPRIEKVQQLQRELRSGERGMMFRGRRGNRGDRGGRGNHGQQANPISQAGSALHTTLEDKSATADQIKAKLDALRQARQKVQTDLTKAQSDLRGVLSVRQEAQLVLMGVLN